MLRPRAVALASLITLSPAAALAQDKDGPAYQLSWEVDAPLLLLSGALASSFFLRDEVEGPRCAPNCDASRINAFDRGVAGNRDESLFTVGDIAVFTTLAYGPVMLVAAEGFGDGLNDTLVVAESALAASALQVIISYAVKRPRPYVYSDESPLEDRTNGNAARSFYSGHVANGLAAAMATSIAFFRLERETLGWISLGIGVVGSGAIGVARIQSGSHFPSDVLVGAAIGAAIGVAVPALHDYGFTVEPLAMSSETKGVAIGARF